MIEFQIDKVKACRERAANRIKLDPSLVGVVRDQDLTTLCDVLMEILVEVKNLKGRVSSQRRIP